jgi:hypothetical protein
MASLPRDEYPLLAETARQAHRMNATEEFRRRLAIVLDGPQASSTGSSRN